MNFLEVKNIESSLTGTVYYHLPGLFEFYDFYRVFLPLFYEHREYFYDWCDIGSIYGAHQTVYGVADVFQTEIVILKKFLLF